MGVVASGGYIRLILTAYKRCRWFSAVRIGGNFLTAMSGEIRHVVHYIVTPWQILLYSLLSMIPSVLHGQSSPRPGRSGGSMYESRANRFTRCGGQLTMNI
mgnify:CR=1 FL=1